MAFQAGSIIAKAFLDTKNWTIGANTIEQTNKKIGSGFASLGKTAAITTAAITSALGAAVFKANEFGKSFSNVTTLLDESTVDVSGMKSELLGLDARLGSATDLTKGLYQTLSASVDPAKAVQFVGESAKFAKAALVDTNTAVDVITTGLNAYGKSADEAGKVSDILFTTIKRGKTTGEELGATIGSIIPLSANMNLSFENLGASIATMTRQGVGSAEATTQLQAVMTALLKPSEKMAASMKKAGFETGEAVTSSENFQEALQKVINQTDGSQESIAELFPNVRALRGALALTGEGAQGFTDDLIAMTNSAGATDEAFGKQRITFETVANNIEKLAITIGEALLPVIDSIVNAISDGISWFLNLDAGTQQLILTIAGLAAAIPIAITAIGALSGAISFLAANPIVAAIGGVGLLATAVVGIVKQTEEANTKFEAQATIITNTTKSIEEYKDALKNAFTFEEKRRTLPELQKAYNNALNRTKKLEEEKLSIEKDGLKVIDARGKFSIGMAIAAEKEKDTKGISLQLDEKIKQSKAEELYILDEIQKIEEEIKISKEKQAKIDIETLIERDEFNKKFHLKLLEQASDRVAILEIEKQEALAQADSIGADRLQIETYYQNEINAIRNENKEIAIQYEKELTAAIIEEEAIRKDKTQEWANSIVIAMMEASNAAGNEIDKITLVWIDMADSIAKTTQDQLLTSLTLIGESLASGADMGKTFVDAINNIVGAIINNLPTLLLNAGLQAIGAGAIELGILLLGLAGLAAVGAGVYNVLTAEKPEEKEDYETVWNPGTHSWEQQKIEEAANGGIVNGMTLVGEEGPELLNIGKTSTITPADTTAGIMGKGVTMYNTFVVNSDTDAEIVAQKLGRRFQNVQRNL